MITFSRLGKQGNLGNQLFQIASTIGIAQKYGHTYFFPIWNYSIYFKKELPVSYETDNFKLIKEKTYNFYEWNLDQDNYDLSGWIQSEKYFDIEKTKEIFEFSDFYQDLYVKYQFLFSNNPILISVRRGDFVNHPYYFQLSSLFYFKALVENFPNWKSRNLIFVSDDIKYCKYHFSFLQNSFFLENLTPIEQLALGSKCKDFIISNSTFSWWIAWLGEKRDSKIIHPIKNFRGAFASQNNDCDYFPKRWISFDDKKYRLERKYLALFLKSTIYDFFVNLKYIFNKRKKKYKKRIKRLLKL